MNRSKMMIPEEQTTPGYGVRNVKPKEYVDFMCQFCTKCCSNMRGTIMLESLDAFRIAKHLQSQGEDIGGIDDVFRLYAEPQMLEGIYPIFSLKDVGEEKRCVFLKDGRCSIYDVRPRTCRLYPLSVGPGERGKDFEYYLCQDNPHHLSGGKIQVKNWLNQVFRQEDKEFVKREFKMAAQMGKLMEHMDEEAIKNSIFKILYYRYYNFELTEEFLPRYDSNAGALLVELELEKNRIYKTAVGQVV